MIGNVGSCACLVFYCTVKKLDFVFIVVSMLMGMVAMGKVHSSESSFLPCLVRCPVVAILMLGAQNIKEYPLVRGQHFFICIFVYFCYHPHFYIDKGEL